MADSEVKEQLSNEGLEAGIERPIRMGWSLWWEAVPVLTLKIAIPVGVAYWAATLLLQRIAPGVAGATDLALVVLGCLSVAATGSALSQRHTGQSHANPWKLAVARVVPWLLTWALAFSATFLGSLLLVIPGLVLSVRLFWADEFALVHRCSPARAIRESWRLTSGATDQIFTFQFSLGIAEIAIAIPIVLVGAGITWAVGGIAEGPVGLLLLYVLFSVLLVNLYATAHASEIVYFYGLRSARIALGEDAEGAYWVQAAKRSFRRSQHPELPVCEECGEPWDSDDYRPDAEHIFCSRCKAELVRPATDAGGQEAHRA